jgi:hypothetical protein
VFLPTPVYITLGTFAKEMRLQTNSLQDSLVPMLYLNQILQHLWINLEAFLLLQI